MEFSLKHILLYLKVLYHFCYEGIDLPALQTIESDSESMQGRQYDDSSYLTMRSTLSLWLCLLRPS